MRLGDLDALKEEINSEIAQATKVGITVDADYLWSLLNYAIDNAPTVKPRIEYGTDGQPYILSITNGIEERPQGEWIKITRKGTVPVEYVCSCCGRKIYDDYELSIPMSEFYPFCHCGADMKGGEAIQKPNCVTCDHFGKCEGCERGEEE